jgi:hypothetical protein
LHVSMDFPFGVPPSGGSEGLPAQPAPPSAHTKEKRKVGLLDPPNEF